MALFIIAAQPVSGRSYAEKYHFVDSIKHKLEKTDNNEVRKTFEAALNSEDAKKDMELASLLSLAECQLLLRNSKNGNPEIERKMQELALNANGKKNEYLEADIMQALGDLYSSANVRPGLAFEHFQAAYRLYKDFPTDNFRRKREYLFSLAGAYYRYEDYDNAIKYFKEAENAKVAKADVVSNTIYNSLGLCYRFLHKYDSAEWYFRLIYDVATSKNDTAWIGISSGNIGITYLQERKYDEAIPLLEKDIQFSLATHQIRNAAGSMYYLASVYLVKKDYDQAEALLTRALTLVESKGFWPYYPLANQLFTCLSKVYAAKGNMALAYRYADSAMTAKDSVDSKFNALSLAKAQEKIELGQRQLEAEQLSNQKKIQELVRNGLVAGIFLISVIGVLFINRQRLKQKKLEAEKIGTEAELGTAALQLANFRQSVLEKNQIIDHFTNELDKLKKGEEQTDTEVLTQLEQATILTDEQWENFRLMFEKVHKGFFVNLKKKIPDLTQSEVRFLALTKLKLSSKEMASMLGISANAIRMYRHRLRRKLNLDKEDMIEELVESI